MREAAFAVLKSTDKSIFTVPIKEYIDLQKCN